MKYSVDRIEDNIAVLEDIETGEKKEISVEDLPEDIQEGTILVDNEGTYVIDNDEELERKKRIMEKFNRLKK